MPIEKYLESIAQPLLSNPNAFKVTASKDEMGVLLTVTVAPEDMGTLIGKLGETAKAIRHLVRIVGVKHTARVSIKITEPDGTPYKPKLDVKTV